MSELPKGATAVFTAGTEKKTPPKANPATPPWIGYQTRLVKKIHAFQ